MGIFLGARMVCNPVFEICLERPPVMIGKSGQMVFPERFVYSVFHETKPGSPLLLNGERGFVSWNALYMDPSVDKKFFKSENGFNEEGVGEEGKQVSMYNVCC